jgi:quinolinate synthase
MKDDSEIKELQKNIRKLLKERNAILLAHNYQAPEIQDIADMRGDSLELSMRASETEAEVIVFCGVHFMAETASILSPQKTVLLPVLSAGCPMADMITGEDIREIKEDDPDVVIVSYVNTTAEVKAETDICCTSANVIQVINSIEPGKRIFMTPDKNLALYAKRFTGREIDSWDGYCPIHDKLLAESVMSRKDEHPDALFVAHPECRPEVLDLADEIRSTSGMIKFVSNSSAGKFIIGTETGLIYPLSQANPSKVFIPADTAMVCPNMKKTQLRNVLEALESMEPVVEVPERIRKRAIRSVERMLAIPGN